MSGLLVKIAGQMLLKLVTETFASKVIVYTVNEVSKKTTNKLDDKIVGAVAEALGVSVSEEK
jgi:hypothetical protein